MKAAEETTEGLEAAAFYDPGAVAGTPDSATIRRRLARMLRRRVKKFLALAPEIRADANAKTVHDVRVWSRRLQQAITAFFPKPHGGKVRRLRRMPRRFRRGLGEWRNCDALLEIVTRRQRRTRSEAKRQAWELVREYLLRTRDKQVTRAEKKLLREDTGDYDALARRLLGQSRGESPEILMTRLCDSVQGAWIKWRSALTQARQTRAVDDLHAFRVATKALRYRTELLYDLGHKEMKAELKWLRDLQQALGIWHDRQVLDQAVAEAVARPDFLLHRIQAVRVLLDELEKDRGREAQEVEKIFRLAADQRDHDGRPAQ
jgi:CHAD domain-containing protein